MTKYKWYNSSNNYKLVSIKDVNKLECKTFKFLYENHGVICVLIFGTGMI